MSYRLELDSDAERYPNRLDRKTRGRVFLMIDRLLDDPLAPESSKPMRELAGLRSARVGGLRIIFQVDRRDQRVLVRRIAPRGQVYRGLE